MDSILHKKLTITSIISHAKLNLNILNQKNLFFLIDPQLILLKILINFITNFNFPFKIDIMESGKVERNARLNVVYIRDLDYQFVKLTHIETRPVGGDLIQTFFIKRIEINLRFRLIKPEIRVRLNLNFVYSFERKLSLVLSRSGIVFFLGLLNNSVNGIKYLNLNKIGLI
ncbi:hypothetical protein BpHYR1_011002 [Brachionus plicatilis]|uniref:Uncharacterized protein n=1 Tax=Brachionus plicatilis TaxID=10195 RepID=A0A3M7PRS6_BRAPC|nr:hypothetical protein BpHYR1_011002 [Brachionus plicatilis]